MPRRDRHERDIEAKKRLYLFTQKETANIGVTPSRGGTIPR